MLYEEKFTLSVVPPFRLDLTVWALRRRLKNTIDQWNGKEYSRVIIIEDEIVRVSVKQKSETELEVVVKSTRKKPLREVVTRKLQKMLGTERNLNEFYQLADKEVYIRSLAAKFKGVKPPRFDSIFEALINAIACQQVMLDLGIMLLNKLSEKYGRKFEDTDITAYAFPEFNDLEKANEEDLKGLGFSYQKARTIITVSTLFAEGKVPSEDMETLPNEEIRTVL